MIFGGGEFLMEAMDLLKDDVPEFDAKWLEFCRYYNETSAKYVSLPNCSWSSSLTGQWLCSITAKYGSNIISKSGGFSQLYAKLQAYAGERLNDTSIKQAAWNVLNKNTVGVWPPVTKVSGTDVVEPANEVRRSGCGLAKSI
jgi:hypothetical protein